MTDPVTVLALVAAVGVGAQVVTARTKIPAIVLLLASGLVLGPGLGLLDPDRVYGDLLFPAASAAVAFLLFDAPARERSVNQAIELGVCAIASASRKLRPTEAEVASSRPADRTRCRRGSPNLRSRTRCHEEPRR